MGKVMPTPSFFRHWTWFDRPGLLRRSLSSPQMRVLLPVPALVTPSTGYVGAVLLCRLVGGALVLLGGLLVGLALLGGLTLQSRMLLQRSRIW